MIPTVKQVGSFQLHALGAFQVVRCCNNRRLTVYNNNINRQTICILAIWFTTTVDTINSSRFSSSSIRIIPALLLCPWTCTYLRDILSTRHRRPSIATPPGKADSRISSAATIIRTADFIRAYWRCVKRNQEMRLDPVAARKTTSFTNWRRCCLCRQPSRLSWTRRPSSD